MLTNYGLGRAVAALAARSPVQVEIAAIPEERLPAPVEAAAYYIIAEAITNVAKYAAGSGLRGIADRVEALNGRLQVMSPVGVGTTVRAELPRTE